VAKWRVATSGLPLASAAVPEKFDSKALVGIDGTEANQSDRRKPASAVFCSDDFGYQISDGKA